MRIIGIDPGSIKTGWGIIDCHSTKQSFKYVDSGIIFLGSSSNIVDRIVKLSKSLAEILQEHKPKFSAIEEVFVSKNAHSALILGQARGAILATLGMANIATCGYNATLIKKALVGSGHATKKDIQRMVKATFNLAYEPIEDAADALAAAFCHFLYYDKTANKNHTMVKKISLLDLAKQQGKI